VEKVVKNFPHFWRTAAAALALSLSSEAIAQTASVNLKANFGLQFDCERPFLVRNHPIRAEFTAVLNANKSASADLVISGVIFTNTVHFDARLGGASQPAPGGTSRLRVIGSNRIRAIWDLPNNQFILDIVTAGRSCSTSLNIKLKPGKQEYSMFDGKRMYYCSKQKVLRTTCQAN
jgi:hypothetical protein